MKSALDSLNVIRARVERLEGALRLGVQIRTEADLILSGEISRDWADHFGPLWDLMVRFDAALAPEPEERVLDRVEGFRV